MKIISLDLENVKSYKKAHIEFANGTNAICGSNGAGKSTILEAIGFVLFDYLQTSQADLVRHGEKTATASVTIENNGEVYTIIRSCGSNSRYVVFSGNEQITINKGDTIGWLYDFLGISRGEELPTIFKDAVGVPQGLLTTAFLQTAANRKRVFAPLLHVDEYEKAWVNLRDSERSLTTDIHSVEVVIAGLESGVSSIGEMELENTKLQSEIKKLDTSIDNTEAGLKTATELLTAYDILSERIVSSEKQRDIHQVQLQARKTSAEKAETDLVEAEIAQKVVNETELLYDKHTTGSEKLVSLQSDKAVYDSMMSDIRVLNHDLRLTLDRIADANDSLEVIGEAEIDVTLLKPFDAQLEKLDAEIAVANSEINKLKEYERSLNESRDSRDQYTDIFNAGMRSLEKAETLTAEIARKKTNLENLDVDINKIKENGIRTKAEIERREQRLETLSGNQALCPTCGKALSDEDRYTLVEDIKLLIAEWKQEDRKNRDEWMAKAEAIKELERKTTKLERELKELPSQSTVDTYRDTVNRLRSDVEKIESILGKLTSFSSSLPEKLQAQKQLKIKVVELRRAESLASQKDDTIKRILEYVTQKKRANEKLAALNIEVEGYVNLDSDIELMKRQVSASEKGYRLYMENSNLASTVPDKKQAISLFNAQIEQLEGDLRLELFELEDLISRYNRETHTETRNKKNSLTSDVAVLKSSMGQNRTALADLEHKLKALYDKAKELEENNDTHTHLQKVLSTLGFLRQVIRDAGPEITKMIVASVSINADRLFSEIMQDTTSHLEWTENYDIVISSGNHVKHFNQLSGGEQMSAALAVRLALLKEISNIDIAFFDEPTVNLDAQRRESLAQQILEVRGFSQLFVISHDDSFEQGTDNVVRINKVDGVSEVI